MTTMPTDSQSSWPRYYRTLKRVLGGYLMACFMAGIVIGCFLTVPAVSDPGSSLSLSDSMFLAVVHVGMATAFVVFLSFIPATFMIFVTELWAIQSRAVYLATGLVTSIVSLIISLLWSGSHRLHTPLRVLEMWGLMMCVAGLVAGYTYWKIAGRRAGRWRPSV